MSKGMRSNSRFLSDAEPHPIEWTPRPNAVRFSSVTDSRHALTSVCAARTGLSPLESRFSLCRLGSVSI
jgi:hypothetical protein